MDPRPRLAPPYGDDELWAPERRPSAPRGHSTSGGATAPAVRPVLVELAGGLGMSPMAASAVARSLEPLGFEIDESADVVSVRGDGGVENYVVTGTVADAAAEEAIEARPEVVKVWRDSPIAPF